MKITNVQLRLNTGKANSKTLAWANVTLDKAIIINNVVLIESKNGGYMIFMPNHKKNNKTYEDIKIIDCQLFYDIRESIIEQYELQANTQEKV